MTRVEHLLACLIEECAEVQKEATKALRFGLSDKWKNRPIPKEGIATEFCDLLAVVEMLEEEGAIPSARSWNQVRKKKDRVIKYMAYARERGVLNDGD